MSETVHMFLIYPGMTDFEEVEIIAPARLHGFCAVRPMGADDEMIVHTSRLVDEATAIARTQTHVIERDGYTVTERTVRS